ncbi:terminal uridylyltransferase Tailor-like [Rhopalosiphum maidis]|uniref:terminal uridylyltransferase Tailor-like n=1 Tax=Rhopalosiphum maidis TaxID=43146 RepID=UPI000F00A739|nr:terminal uridylyltransferase Tailor-like [Rhopalosiphum maidis]
MNNLLNNEKMLEKKREYTSSILTEDDRLSEVNKTEVMQFVNNKSLIKSINTQLAAINQEIYNHDIIDRLDLLLNSIRICACHHFKGSRTYAFGSRITGLANKHSDVDLYIEIANSFCGELSNDPYAQNDLIRYVEKLFRSQKYEYSQIRSITTARVPIIKFFHVPTGFYCDLSFRSGLSIYNTRLVKLYLSLDERVYWVVCAVVKCWALDNYIKEQCMFNSYALAWLVLFYLMAIKVVPPLLLLREHADHSNSFRSDVIFIEGWNCTFCTVEKAKQIWRVPAISRWNLLFGFLKFYSDSNKLNRIVLCPVIGTSILKDNMYKVPMMNPDILGFDPQNNGLPIDWCIKLKNSFRVEGLALQDPLDLLNNLTKRTKPDKLQIFSYSCNLSLEVMKNKRRKLNAI